MSRVDVVDQAYRLQVRDLGPAARRLQITNVTMQGLEEMTPTLHFAGEPKRLTLSREQSRALIDITGTTVTQQWIGVNVLLVPALSEVPPAIRIESGEAKKRAAEANLRLPTGRKVIAALLIAAILLAGATVLASAALPTLLALLENTGFVPR